jgi:hypothetical protein
MAESPRRRFHIGRPGRIAAVRTLVVLGTILAVISVFAIWVNRLVLDTNTWVDTSDALLADDEVRATLATTLTDSLYSSVDVAGQLRAVLPPAAQSLAAPAAAGLRELTERRANKFLTRPRVVQAWSDINRATHERFVKIVKGEAEAVQTQNGEVVLVLRPILAQLAEQVGLANVAQQLPADAGTIVIMDSSQLDTIKTLVRILDIVASWLWAVAVALWALAVYLSPGRRLKTLRGIAYGLLFVGLTVLAVIRVGGNFLVDSLVRVEANETAAQNAFSIITATLKTSAWTLIAIAIIMIVGGWLSGSNPRATALRQRSAPVLRDNPEYVWGGFALLVLLLLIWGPIQATRNLLGIVVLVGFAALGLWVFRRQALEELAEGKPRE